LRAGALLSEMAVHEGRSRECESRMLYVHASLDGLNSTDLRARPDAPSPAADDRTGSAWPPSHTARP